jgi:hypothetical protein
MQKENEMIGEIKNYFTFENIRIVAICCLFGFISGAALVIYYVKINPPLFLGSGIYKTSMISIGKKEFSSAEDAGTLIIFSDRRMLDNVDCGSSINGGSRKSSITASVVDKKSNVIRIDGRDTDPQFLNSCISIYIDLLSSYDQEAALNFKTLETFSKPNNAISTRENIQVNIVKGGIIGEIYVSKFPIRQYPISLFKLIFLFSLGGFFVGILICYCKAIFFDPP